MLRGSSSLPQLLKRAHDITHTQHAVIKENIVRERKFHMTLLPQNALSTMTTPRTQILKRRRKAPKSKVTDAPVPNGQRLNPSNSLPSLRPACIAASVFQQQRARNMDTNDINLKMPSLYGRNSIHQPHPRIMAVTGATGIQHLFFSNDTSAVSMH